MTNDPEWCDYAMRLRNVLEYVRQQVDYDIGGVISDVLAGEPPPQIQRLRDEYPGETAIQIVGWTPAGNVLDISAHVSNEQLAAMIHVINSTNIDTGRLLGIINRAIEASDNDGGSASDAIQDMLGILYEAEGGDDD